MWRDWSLEKGHQNKSYNNPYVKKRFLGGDMVATKSSESLVALETLKRNKNWPFLFIKLLSHLQNNIDIKTVDQ